MKKISVEIPAPKFTEGQEYNICSLIDVWYLNCKNKIFKKRHFAKAKKQIETTLLNNLGFTKDQQNYMVSMLKIWYWNWKKRIVNANHKTKTNNLGYAKEDLKKMPSLTRIEAEQQELNEEFTKMKDTIEDFFNKFQR